MIKRPISEAFLETQRRDPRLGAIGSAWEIMGMMRRRGMRPSLRGIDSTLSMDLEASSKGGLHRLLSCPRLTSPLEGDCFLNRSRRVGTCAPITRGSQGALSRDILGHVTHDFYFPHLSG